MTALQLLSWLSIGTPGLLLRLGGSLAALGGLFLVASAGIKMWKKDSTPSNSASGYSRTSETEKKANGKIRLTPAALLFCCAGIMIFVPLGVALAEYWTRFPIYELHNVDVISKESKANGETDYWMLYTSESVGRIKFLSRFCADYIPPFDAGDHLNLLRYQDKNTCWSIKDERAGVLIRRDARGRSDSELQN